MYKYRCKCLYIYTYITYANLEEGATEIDIRLTLSQEERSHQQRAKALRENKDKTRDNVDR